MKSLSRPRLSSGLRGIRLMSCRLWYRERGVIEEPMTENMALLRTAEISALIQQRIVRSIVMHGTI